MLRICTNTSARAGIYSWRLDLTGSYDKQRTITIGTTPSVGALVMPIIYQAIRPRYPQLLLRNIPVDDAESQLSQFQTDLIINTHSYNNRSIQHHVLFSDTLEIVCRQHHPCLANAITEERLNSADHTFLMLEGQHLSSCASDCRRHFPISKSVLAATIFLPLPSLIASSDLLGLMPTRFYDLFSRCWPLERLPYAPVNSEQVEFSLHYNKLSLRDPVLENVIDIIREAF